jgi:hypothetical protein
LELPLTDPFQAIDDAIGFIEKFRRVRIGHGQTFHAGVTSATDSFPGILDD